MSLTQEPRVRGPIHDPHLESAAERVRVAAEELERLGIADHTGKCLRDDLPEDMRESAERDSGG